MFFWVLCAEVEQLLGLEERAILQQNATYNLDKISTVSFQNYRLLLYPYYEITFDHPLVYYNVVFLAGLHFHFAFCILQFLL